MKVLFLLFLSTLLASCASQEKKEKSILYMQSGLAFYESGNYPQALSAFLKAEELYENNASLHNNIGLTYFMREKYELSIKHLERAIDIEPKFSEARNNLARVLIEIGKYNEAEKNLNIVTSDLTYINIDKAYFNLGLLKFNQKNYDEALVNFEKSLKQNPSSCLASAYFGRSYFEKKSYELATTQLDRAVGLCHKISYDEPHYYSALAYYRMGKKERAIARFKELIKLYPEGQYVQKTKALLKIINEEKQ